MCWNPLRCDICWNCYFFCFGWYLTEEQTRIETYIQSTQRGFSVFHLTTADKFYLARSNVGGQQAIGADDRQLSPPRNRQQGAVAVIRSPMADCLMVAYIRRTFSPIMLVSIKMCVFFMLLKYRTLYPKSKMSLNREKLITNGINMSTI